MRLYKLVTSHKPTSEELKNYIEVTEVTDEVTNKSIDRDTIYNKVTSVTSELHMLLMRARTHARGYKNTGNRGNRGNRRLPIRFFGYLTQPIVTFVTYNGGIL